MANKEKKMTRTETRSHSWKELEDPALRSRLEAEGFRHVSRSSDMKMDHYQREVAVDPEAVSESLDPGFASKFDAAKDLEGAPAHVDATIEAMAAGKDASFEPKVDEPVKPEKTKEKKGHA